MARAGGTTQARPLIAVSVARAVAGFLLAGLVVLTVIGAVLALAQRDAATEDAIRDAKALTDLQAEAVVGPALSSAALVPGPAYDELDRIVRERVLGALVVRVKVWDETGRIVYSDDRSLVGKRFELPPEELEVLRTGRVTAEVSDLQDPEHAEDAHFGRLLQVYLGVRTPTGQPLLFETYQPYDTIREASRRQWLTSLPVLVGGLVLLYLLQAPLAYSMARRLRSAQEEREQLLVAGLAAADRERTRIASDLHDGVLQGLAGASYSLTATAGAARAAGDHATAASVTRTAVDLRRWVRELRSLVVSVTPPALHGQGLEQALADLVAPLEPQGVLVRLRVVGAEGLPEQTEALVHRVAQEALRNVARHAGARTVEVELARDGGALTLRVADDGRGFEPGAPTRPRGSVGLELLCLLVGAQGGSLDVRSSPGTGTAVLLRLPVPQALHPDPVTAGAR